MRLLKNHLRSTVRPMPSVAASSDASLESNALRAWQPVLPLRPGLTVTYPRTAAIDGKMRETKWRGDEFGRIFAYIYRALERLGKPAKLKP